MKSSEVFGPGRVGRCIETEVRLENDVDYNVEIVTFSSRVAPI